MAVTDCIVDEVTNVADDNNDDDEGHGAPPSARPPFPIVRSRAAAIADASSSSSVPEALAVATGLMQMGPQEKVQNIKLATQLK